MDPFTHLLTGACLGRAGLNRKTALATATLTLAAEAPDVDMLAGIKGHVAGFAHHRGFTHSFLGGLLVAVLVVGVIYLVWRLRGRKIKDPGLPPRWGLLFLYSYLAVLSHILLDFTTAYGIRPFWPFSERWFSWDIVAIIEPVLLIILIAGLVLPLFFALINEEIGARRKGPKGRLAATLALLAMVAVWGVRDYEHRRAVNVMTAQLYEGMEPLRVSAYPNTWNPFQWHGVAETQNFFALMNVDSLAPDVDPEGRMQIRFKPQETPATLAAKKSYLGRVYLDWARYPVTETEQREYPRPGYIVRFLDLRYASVGLAPNSLSATVELDGNLQVVNENFGRRRSSSQGTR